MQKGGASSRYTEGVHSWLWPPVIAVLHEARSKASPYLWMKRNFHLFDICLGFIQMSLLLEDVEISSSVCVPQQETPEDQGQEDNTHITFLKTGRTIQKCHLYWVLGIVK